MPLDLYGDKPVGVAQTAAGQQFETGKQLGAGGLFTSSAAMGAYGSKAKYNQQRMNEAINAWGTDLIIDWNKNSEQLIGAVKEDLTDMRQRASQARQANDMEMYKLALQKTMFDKQMLAYAQALDKARIGDIITSIVAGLGQLGAGFFTSDAWEQYKAGRPQRQRTRQIERLDLAPFEWDMA